MIGARMSPGVLGVFATLFVLVQASPLLRFPRESEDYPNSDFSNYTANEVCFSDQKVYQRGEEVPNAGPCEECRCEPPSIVCQMLKCPVNNNGCRTIQRPNHCCPDYNCECDYNGQLYNDGERIDLPEDPCQVCYCKGGDVMCTSITCYHRDDCEPKHVPGQCCPKYEDCPIRDMEASNTEDKSVQTRSPNKTMNNNPKKEMQPWLLTKSVPQTSSSLAVSKPGETTTDSGNVIIVSDWLVERKTTEDFNTKHTEDPDYSTHREFITTTPPQIPIENIEKESNYENKIQTVKPTPVDEVVFTRIDIPKRIQEEVQDSPTTTVSTKAENSTSVALNLTETINDFKILSKNMTSTLPSNSSYKYLEEKLIAVNKTDKENSTSNKFDKQPENESMTTMSSTDLPHMNLLMQTSTITKKAPMQVDSKKDKNVVETSTPEHFEIKITENSLDPNKNTGSQEVNKGIQDKTSATKPDEHFEGSRKQSQGITVLDNTDRSSEEMALEHLFGLDELEKGDSRKQSSTSTENYHAGNTITLLEEQNKNGYTTHPEKIEKLLVVEDSKHDSLQNKPLNQIVKIEEMTHLLNNTLTRGETHTGTHLYEIITTEPSYGEEETHTYFPSELNIKKQPESGKFEYEKEEETTYLPEITTDIETSTLIEVTIPKQINDEAKENVLENFLEGKQEDKIGYDTNIDTTTPSSTENSGYTNPVMSESSKSSTSQGFELNTRSMLNEDNYNNNIQEEVNAFTDSTSTPDYNETTKNSLSEIEIVLEETNNSNVLHKSISSQESNEQVAVPINLAIDDISSENKGVIHANHPPVLELNSHVPFLQIGGDGNSESSETDYDKTTEVNNLDVVDSFHNKAIQGNEEIIKLTQTEDTSNSSVTITPSYTTIEILSGTKEPSKEKVEDFTIPTIAVVPLTPGDLKMIAEYLISENIKPAPSKNNSMYSPNQWLKGNLTSEENIASILSAANISIGLMNETNIGRKLETFSKSNKSVRFDKFEKENRYKSNSILGNKNVINSKTDYLHDKNSDNQDTFKSTVYSQEGTKNNDGITRENISTEASSDDAKTTTAMPLSTSSRSKKDFEKLQNLNTERTSTEIINKGGIHTNKSDTLLKSDNSLSSTATTAGRYKTDHKVISEHTTKSSKDNEQSETTTVDNINLNLENINVHKADTNQETTQIISRLPVPDEKPADSFTTNKIDTNSKVFISKPSHNGMIS